MVQTWQQEMHKAAGKCCCNRQWFEHVMSTVTTACELAGRNLQSLSYRRTLIYQCTTSYSTVFIMPFTKSHTHTHPFNGPFSGTTQVSRYQKGKTNLDFTGARDSEWQWHQLGHMQVCTSLQVDNHASTPPLSFLQAGCPSCRPTNSVIH